MVHSLSSAGPAAPLLRALAFAALHMAVAVPLCAQEREQPTESPGQRQSESQRQSEKARPVFVMGDRPSLRFGDLLRLDLTSKVDMEVRDSPDVQVDTFDLARRRFGVDGRALGIVGFQIEGDVSDREHAWRDVYVELRRWRGLRVKAGRFKIPFGQERLTSISDLDFASRSVPTETLTSGRDTGVELNGRILGRALNYSAGVFRHDGDVSGAVDAASSRTVAGRVDGTPLSWTGSNVLRRIHAGFNVTAGGVPEGLNGLRARTYTAYEAFAPMYVSGSRIRIGADSAFAQGPVSVRAEYLEARDERERQGLLDENLPDIVARGGYVSAASFVLGRLKSNGLAPRAPLGGGGLGAIQLAGRVEWLTFRSHAPREDALRNPRAATIMPNDFRAATIGVNWFPVRFVKVQLNLIREHLQDPERRPSAVRPWVTSGVMRVQFAL